MQQQLIQPWLIDDHLKLQYNKGGKSLSKIRENKRLLTSPWYHNLKACFERADADTIKHGKSWYTDAHKYCVELATEYNVSVEVVAQVVAALSPATKWEQNLRDAKRLLDSYYHRGYIGCKATTVCTYGPNKTKAIEVLLGNKQLEPTNGLKTFNFYNNILNPQATFYVTIDRHAFNVLQGKAKRGAVKITVKDYYKAAKIYRLLASEKGLTPCQLQAITWVQYRKELGLS